MKEKVDQWQTKNCDKKKNEQFVNSEESNIENFTNNSCVPTKILDVDDEWAGSYYQFKTRDEEDAQTCQGFPNEKNARNWVKKGPRFKQAVNNNKQKYFMTANTSSILSLNENSTNSNCESGPSSYGSESNQYWDPNETSLLTVSFQNKGAPETFENDPNELTSDVAMKANNVNRLPQ